MSWKSFGKTIIGLAFIVLFVGVLLCFVGVLLCLPVWWAESFYVPTEHQVNITVSEKWIKTTAEAAGGYEGAEYYLFSDTSGNVYKIADDTYYGKYNSSNQYAQLKSGHNYTIDIVGWRDPVNSEYQNLLWAKEI